MGVVYVVEVDSGRGGYYDTPRDWGRRIFWGGREYKGQSQCSRGLACESEAACLLGLQVRIQQGA